MILAFDRWPPKSNQLITVQLVKIGRSSFKVLFTYDNQKNELQEPDEREVTMTFDHQSLISSRWRWCQILSKPSLDIAFERSQTGGQHGNIPVVLGISGCRFTTLLYSIFKFNSKQKRSSFSYKEKNIEPSIVHWHRKNLHTVLQVEQ